MMAARRSQSPQDRDQDQGKGGEAKQKDGRDHSEASAATATAAAADASPADEEPFSWPGPKTLHLRRTSQGFGFTLRHFIVYPPESAVHNSMKDEENGSRGRQRNRLEPMDTIFVKQVKEGGPAHGAGLCTGDRIVKVNGESIIGKTYSQVIALIQNSDASLELCVMPKDEDILQLFSRDITALAYSQDAYLKGNQAYSGNAQNIPEPPPICYPRIEVKAVGRGQGAEPPGRRPPPNDRSHRPDVPLPCQRSAAASPEPPDAGSRSRDDRFAALPDQASPRPRPLIPSLPGGAQPQKQLPRGAEPLAFSPAARGICPDMLTPLTRAPLAAPSPDTLSTAASPSSNRYSPSPSAPSPSPSPSALTPAPAPAPSSSPHQNIDWRTYTTYKDYIDAKRLHTYGCRTIQERLDSLRAAANSSSAYAQQRPAPTPTPTPTPTPMPSQRGTPPARLRRRSASNDDGGGRAATAASPLRSVSQERLGVEGEAPSSGVKWPRSASQDALPPSGLSGPGQGRARSCDFLGQRPAGGGGEGAGSEERLLVSRGEEARASRLSPALRAPQLGRGPGAAGSFHRGTDWAPHPRTEPHLSRPSRLPVKNCVPDFASPKAPDPLRDQRAGVAANHPGGPVPPQTQTQTQTQTQPRGRADSLRAESRGEAGLAARSSSCSSKLPLQRQSPAARTNGGPPEGVEGADATVVVLRREKSSGTAHVRPPSYAPAVNDGKGVRKSPLLVKAGSLDGVMSRRSADRGDGETRRWTPGETRTGTGSGSKDLDRSLDSIPFIDEPSSPSLEQDSAPLPPLPPTITTIPPSPPSPSPLIRRQLSHDQDSLRLTIIESDSATKSERSKSCDEGLDTYRDEARGRSLIPGLKTLRKTVDRSSEDSASRRHSSSDVLCDTTKEGLLHVKQLNTEKSKQRGGGGGGIRPWKQMYVVLRGQHLYLYKERREPAAAAGGEEPLAISVKACLIDISYSDTKRKNVLRLTTSACECLFQAEDREDMLAWIKVIQESSSLDQENASFTSHDLISRKIKEYNTLMSPTGSKSDASPRASRQSLSIRHSLLGGKEAKASSPHSPRAQHQRRNMHKDDTSPPKDRGPWRKGLPGLMRKPFEKKPSAGVTFGVRLDDCPPAHNNKFVPLIVEVCCKLVEERGLEYTGIYRVPGNNAAISSMQEELNNKGMGDIDIQDDKWRDLNVISSLLKSFFRKLPEPLFTNDKYSDFIEANRIDDPVDRLKVLKCLLHELPDHHYETLKFLSAHLKTVADNSEKNKMEPRNLAIVFGPTLVRTTEDNMTHMVTHMPDQYKIVETLIQNYDWFFTEDGNGDPVTVSVEDSAVESQPLPNIDHLLTNIGRTAASQGEVSDSPTSDSAKSKGSWGSGKDRELLVSSIFAAASRKRKKSKEKPQPSSSDDDLDAVFPKKEPHAAKGAAHADRKESGRAAQLTPKAKREHRAPSLPRAQTPPAGRPSPAASPPQPDDNTSDLSTVSSGASCQRWRPGKWAAAPGAEVSSITSDYSTTSSLTFPTGAEAAALGPQAPGDDADDERSELVSEGRPMETDSESDFPVFAAAQSTPRPHPAGRATTPKMEARRLFPPHGTPEPAAGRRWSLRQKTDSESSAEGGGGSGEARGGGVGEASTRLSRVLEVMKKGRSTSSLSSSSRSESERGEPAWHLRITERLRFRLRSSADDTFAQKGGGEARAKKNNIRRRHTMGGQRDFAQLAVINDWREQSAAAGAELSALDHLKPRCSSQDFSFRDWISRERRRASCGGAAEVAAPKAVPEDDGAEARDAKAPPASVGSEHVNGGGPQAKGRAALGGEAHPHKLGGAQVVRSRFYQYL